MGCNCGKKRTPPLGATTKAAPGTKRPAPAIQPRPGTSKSTGQTQTFTLQRRDGTVTSFGSLLEARAARQREGGVLR